MVLLLAEMLLFPLCLPLPATCWRPLSPSPVSPCSPAGSLPARSSLSLVVVTIIRQVLFLSLRTTATQVFAMYPSASKVLFFSSVLPVGGKQCIRDNDSIQGITSQAKDNNKIKATKFHAFHRILSFVVCSSFDLSVPFLSPLSFAFAVESERGENRARDRIASLPPACSFAVYDSW